MKWFAATNESSLYNDQFFDQLKSAVLSAKINTLLDLYIIYEGGENEKIKWLRENGVSIIFHELSIRKKIEEYIKNNNYNDNMINVRTGAYLRSEIPLALEKNGILDRYILYTDCDVIFLKNPDLEKCKPKYIAASAGSVMGGYTRYHIFGNKHFNSGVMVMNVHRLRDEHNAFIDFVLHNGYGVKRPKLQFMHKNLFMSDQVAYNLYYKGKIKEIDKIYNWRPRMGINPNARIIHFNGLKWTQWNDYINELLPADQMEKFSKLVNANKDAYVYYVDLAKKMLELEKKNDVL